MSQKAWIHNLDQYPDPLLPKVLNPDPYMAYMDPHQRTGERRLYKTKWKLKKMWVPYRTTDAVLLEA